MKVHVADVDISCYLTNLKSTATINASSCFWAVWKEPVMLKEKFIDVSYWDLCFTLESRSTSHKDLIQIDRTDENYPKGSLHRQIKDEFYLINSEYSWFSSAISIFLWNMIFIFPLVIQSSYHMTLH